MSVHRFIARPFHESGEGRKSWTPVQYLTLAPGLSPEATRAKLWRETAANLLTPPDP